MDNQIQIVQKVNQQTGMSIANTRAENEVKAMALVAMHNPRNEIAALGRIKQSCKRIGLAKVAQYAFPRGGKVVTGPSINLARAVAGTWGNMDFGTIELEQRDGESHVMAYAVDLESNTRESRTFVVKHEMKAKGVIKKLTDPRDISEFVSNQAARRLRSCILGIIPGDIIDTAVEECEKTLKGNNDIPIKDRIVKMVDAFSGFGVTGEMIEEKLGHNLEAIIEQEYADLISIFNSLKDGAAKRDDFFKVGNDKTPDIKKPFLGAKPKKEETEKTEVEGSAAPNTAVPKKKEELKAETVEPKTKLDEEKVKRDAQERLDAAQAKAKANRDTASRINEAEPSATPGLPETSNMPKLSDMMKDSNLYPEQLIGWAEKNNHDLSDDSTVCKVINSFEKVRDQIDQF